MTRSGALASTVRAISYNMFMQMMIRLMTFVVNAVLLRYISQDLLGVVNVRLTLLYSTILFVTKEAFEQACLSRHDGQNWRHVINLMWCTFPIGVVVSVLLSFVWLHLQTSPDPDVVPYYTVGVVAFAMSACVEVLVEPLYVAGQAFFFIRLKVLTLGLAQAVKCVIALLLVQEFPNWGVYSFAVAQVISSACYVAMYFAFFTYYLSTRKKKDDDDQFPFTSMADLFPRWVPGEPFFDLHLVHLTWSFFKQSFIKQILTEGERYVMTFFNILSFADQGVYDVINNLGSLVARLIFLPFEENGYLFFCQTLTRGKPAKEQTEDNLALSSKVLEMFLKVVTLIGCIAVMFGYANSFLLLHIYGGNRLSLGTGPTLLRWYCIYVLLLAVNGITERFVFATMSKEQVDRYNQKMLAFSVLFLAAAWLFTSYIGSVGFILANCINMLLRILHSLLFIKNYFSSTGHQPLAGLIPSVPVIASLVFSLVVTAISEVQLVHQGSVLHNTLHIGVTGLCLLQVLVIIFFTEKSVAEALTRTFTRQVSGANNVQQKQHAQ